MKNKRIKKAERREKTSVAQREFNRTTKVFRRKAPGNQGQPPFNGRPMGS